MFTIRLRSKVFQDMQVIEDELIGGFLKRDNARAMMDLTAEHILDACAAQVDDDGIPWAPLSPTYRAWKDIIAPGAPIGVLYDHMLQPVQVEGERDFAAGPGSASMTYGVDDTARAEAYKFQEGINDRGLPQPERRFYALSTHAIAALDAHNDSFFFNFNLTP